MLCRFADDPSTPHRRAWYRKVMSGGERNAADYWREASLGRMSVDGNDVKGWYDLPRKRSWYFGEAGQFVYEDGLVEHCAAAAGADVFLPRYDGLTVWVNGSLVAPATGARRDSGRPATLTLDGRKKRYWFVVQSSDDVYPLGRLVQNMGESFGWGFTEAEPFESGGRGLATAWDLMSGVSEGCWHVYEPRWCVPVHPVALWKHVSGWIPDDRVVEVYPGETTTVSLHPHEVAPSVEGGAQLVLVPLRNSQVDFLTLEARRQVGYDRRPVDAKLGLPGEGVIVHRLHLEDADVFLLDDSPGDGEIADEEARRGVGEVYRDASGVEISVEGETESGAFVVTISHPPLPAVANDDFARARLLLPTDRVEINTYAAGLEEDDPASACTRHPDGHTTWYRFTPPTDGHATFDTAGSDHWTVVGVFAGEHGDLVNLGCQDAQSLDPNSSLRDVPLRAGTTYYFETSSAWWWEGGNLAVSFSFSPGEVETVEHRTSVRFDLDDHLVATGDVHQTDWSGVCFQRVPVEIRRLVDGRWDAVANGRSDDYGHFEIPLPDRRGTYEAVVPERTAYGHFCPRTNGTRVHRH